MKRQFIVQFIVCTGKAISDEREREYRVTAETWQEAEQKARPYLEKYGAWSVLDVVLA